MSYPEKKGMKKVFYGLLLLVLLAGCSKDSRRDSFRAHGTLTSLDPTMCACCGGVFLTIDNDPATYRIYSLPSMTTQELYNLNFPRRIRFNYESAGFCGPIERLEISLYEFEH